ncbi:hypothetical protein AB0F93_03425 [Micromonospora tulbaghiae]|uniref:hypothetical protein n=1 Tax=Micromonospora tulbaghiae TaxID=479978 RepID=UPI0033206482
MTGGRLALVQADVEQAEAAYLQTLRDEAAAMLARAEAKVQVFRARQAWCAEHNAALPDGSTEHLVACRDCLRAVPIVGGHEVTAESGEMLYARCGDR